MYLFNVYVSIRKGLGPEWFQKTTIPFLRIGHHTIKF